MAEYVITFLFLGLPALAGMSISGYNSAYKSDTLRKTIVDLNKLNKTNTDIVNQFIKSSAQLSEQQREKIQELNDSYSIIKDSIKLSLDDFNNTFRNMQYVMIVIIIIIFFLLLLKTYGVLGDFYYMLAYPFIYLWKLITK